METPKGLIPTIIKLINIAEDNKELIEGIDKKNFVKNKLKQILNKEIDDIIDPIIDSIIDGLVDIANEKLKLFKKSKFSKISICLKK